MIFFKKFYQINLGICSLGKFLTKQGEEDPCFVMRFIFIDVRLFYDLDQTTYQQHNRT